MKIFSWMQSKLNTKQVTKKPNSVVANNQASTKEEFSDWPQSLLAIGTFGISNLRGDPKMPEEEEEEEEKGEEISFMETSAEEEEEKSDAVDMSRDVAHLQSSISGVFSRDKDIFLVDQKNNNVIRKKTLTFLLKKMFTSRNTTRSSLRNSLPDPTFDKSRMEKMLQAILNKKIHPQTCTAKPMPNKYLVTKDMSINDDSDDDNEGSTWVKTDSEYIVLEI